MATEQNSFERLHTAVSSDEFAAGMRAYSDVVVDPIVFLADRGVALPEGAVVTVEITSSSSKPPKKEHCWEVCVGWGSAKVCYKHCSDEG